MERQIGTVVAKDASGTLYTLKHFADEKYFDAANCGNPTGRASRPSYRLELETGEEVRYEGKGRYWFENEYGTVVNLMSDDPNAP